MYKIQKIETSKHAIPLTKAMKDNIIPAFNKGMLVLNGRTGSGKSNLLINLLINKNLYGGYFNEIYYLSPTAGAMDDLVKQLKLKDDHILNEFNEDTLQMILDQQEQKIKDQGMERAAHTSRLCLILDDVISEKKLLNSPQMVQLACACRHRLIMPIILSQSWTRVPRYMRLQANGIFLFPSSSSEVEILTNEYCPPSMNKKDFKKMVGFATADKYSFLFINNGADMKERFRKNLDTILEIKSN